LQLSAVQGMRLVLQPDARGEVLTDVSAGILTCEQHVVYTRAAYCM
jgi:hypothetical protein